MNETAKQYYNKDNPPQSTSIISLVKDILKDSDLSVHASNILAQLVLASGYSGFCWMLIDTISKNSRLGRTQTKLYLKELETKKRIKVHPRPGRSSKFQVLDITNQLSVVSRSTDYRKEYKIKENVTERPNVILTFPDKENHPVTHSETETPPTLANRNKIIIKKPIPPSNIEVPKPIKPYSNVVDINLLKEILEITGDKKSTACFIKIVKNVPKNVVYAAISSLKIGLSEGIVSKPGAYFVSTIKNYCPDVFTGQKTCQERSVTKSYSIVAPPKTSKKQCFEQDNIIQASPEVALEAIGKIKLILNRPRYNILCQEKKVGK
jgi:hypothetical protein